MCLQNIIRLLIIVPDIVDGAGGVGLEVLLALGHEPLEALDVLPLGLVVQHVGHMFAANKNYNKNTTRGNEMLGS